MTVWLIRVVSFFTFIDIISFICYIEDIIGSVHNGYVVKTYSHGCNRFLFIPHMLTVGIYIDILFSEGTVGDVSSLTTASKVCGADPFPFLDISFIS